MAQPQTTPQDRLAKARDLIAIAESVDSKREAYVKAAAEMQLVKDADWTYAAIGREVGMSPTRVRELLAWANSPTRVEQGLPWGRGDVKLDQSRERYHAKQALRDPEQRQRVVSQMDDDEMDAVRDTVAEERLNRARARAAEHRPALADRKAREAEHEEEVRDPTMKALGSMVSPDAYIDSAIETMKLIEAESLQMGNYEHCVELLQELNDRMWRYGAVHGFDVSKIAEAAAKLRGEGS